MGTFVQTHSGWELFQKAVIPLVIQSGRFPNLIM
jgi:hypothetical protein